jgi:hypothetical protein
MIEIRNSYIVLVGKPAERPKCIWENNIKMG